MNEKEDSIDHDFFNSSDSEDEEKPLNSTFTKSRPAHGDAKVYISSIGDDEKEHEEKESITVHVPLPPSRISDHHQEKDQESDGSTDSVTDVSPLSSPNRTPQVKNRKVRSKSSVKNKEKSKLRLPQKYYSSSCSESESSSADGDVKKLKQFSSSKRKQKEILRQRNEISMHNHRQRLLDVAAQNSMDLSQLLEVILTMNDGKYKDEYVNNPFGPSLGPQQKKNLSFTNQQVFEIDRENQRLLKELAKANKRSHGRPSSASSSRSSMSISSRASSRPSTSALGYRPMSTQPRLHHAGRNRIREQQKIEKENFALLKRLQTAKSDKNIRRKKLLDDYKKQTNYMSNSLSRPSGSSVNKTYHRHLQRHGFNPSKPEWQN